jgi:acylglycerol lipase
MSEVKVPYDPINTPIVAVEEFNGAKMKTVSWKVPQGTPYKGKVIYVHGFNEDSKVYTQFFDNLCSNGIEVFFFEQRGAGEYSQGKLRGKTNEFHTFNDLDHFIKKNLDEASDKLEKFFLAGHSMGGGIVLNYGINGTYKDFIKAIIACGPLITLIPESQPNFILKSIMPAIVKLLPNFQIDTKLNYDYITANQDWKNYVIKSTPKFIGTPKQLYDMLARGEKLLNKSYAGKFNHPLLIVHGKDDQINDVNSSEIFYNNLSDKSNKIFYPVDNGKHSLFIEIEPIYNDVFNRVVNFIEQNK